MSFTPTAVALATAETLRELPMAAWMYGVAALASFVVLLGVLWSFRNTAAKHDRPATQATQATAGPGDLAAQGSHGAADPGAHH